MQEFRHILTQLGLPEKEIAVYAALLELGMAPASIVARRAKLKRPTTYLILKSLLQKGIADCFLKNKMRYYSVLAPAALFEQYQAYLHQFQIALPQMTALHNALVKKPRIMFYEGKEEVRRLYLDVLTAKGDVLNYFLPDKAYEYFGQQWVNTEHIAERVKRGIRIRAIMPDSPWTRRYLPRGKKELRETRVITDGKLTFTNETYIYDDKMSIFSFEEDFALLIQSKEVTSAERTMFELAWQSALLRKGETT